MVERHAPDEDESAQVVPPPPGPWARAGRAVLRFVGRQATALLHMAPWLACAVASGVMAALSFPPADIGLLAFVAFIPLLTAVGAVGSCWGAGMLGAVAAAVTYSFGFAWVWTVSPLGPPGLVVYVGSYLVLAAIVIRRYQLMFPVLWPLLAAFLWAGLELLRALVGPGFPWLYVGYTQYRTEGLLQLSALGGVYAVSFVVLLVNGSLASALSSLLGRQEDRPPRRALAFALVTVALCGTICIAGRLVRSRVDLREGVVVGVVQQNYQRIVSELVGGEYDEADWYAQRKREVQQCALLSAGLRGRGVRLVAWPESTVAVPMNVPPDVFSYPSAAELRHQADTLIAGLAADMDCHFLIGVPCVDLRALSPDADLRYNTEAGDEWSNSALLFAPDGRVVGRYDKIRLVPFGEYILWEDLLPFMAWFTPIERSLRAGREEVVFELPGGGGSDGSRFGVLICYEDVFPDLTRSFRRKGVDFFVNLTDEGWYPIPGELGQHLAMAVFRAVETRTTVVRAANTGISCFIDPRGRVYESLEPWTEGVLSAPVYLSDGITPYVRWGDLFAGACLAAAAVIPCLAWLARRRHRAKSGADGT
jgi:apolipoprotein N-acyltransferase